MSLEDPTFRFRITRAVAWHHEFPIINRATGKAFNFLSAANEGWEARLQIRDRSRRAIVTLSTDNGRLTLGNGIIEADLTGVTTRGLTATWAPWANLRDHVWADLIAVDPLDPVDRLVADGKGIVRDQVTR